MKIVLCPDSYKNNLSSTEICKVMTNALLDKCPSAQITAIPIADGGEGTLAAFEFAFEQLKKQNSKESSSSDYNYYYVKMDILDPYLRRINAKYLFNGTSAIIESAEAFGLDLVKSEKNVKLTSSYGLGMLIEDALNKGATTIMLALGGSSTSDLGAGMANALGYRFYNKDNEAFNPTAGNLHEVVRFDNSQANKLISQAKFIGMVDCENTLLGKEGAVYTYARQKGATEKDLPVLENNMKSLADLLAKTYGDNFIDVKGGGAAGGAAASSTIFLNAQLQSGIETILDLVSFDEVIKNANFVISGEGKFDYQSFMGKVISGIAKRTRKQNIPLYVVAGYSEITSPMKEYGLYGAYSTNTSDIPLEEKIKRSRQDIYMTTQTVLRDYIKEFNGNCS